MLNNTYNQDYASQQWGTQDITNTEKKLFLPELGLGQLLKASEQNRSKLTWPTLEILLPTLNKDKKPAEMSATSWVSCSFPTPLPITSHFTYGIQCCHNPLLKVGDLNRGANSDNQEHHGTASHLLKFKHSLYYVQACFLLQTDIGIYQSLTVLVWELIISVLVPSVHSHRSSHCPGSRKGEDFSLTTTQSSFPAPQWLPGKGTLMSACNISINCVVLDPGAAHMSKIYKNKQTNEQTCITYEKL